MKSATIRDARRSDLHAIITLLADDPLGTTRERISDPVDECYQRAFSDIERDANNQLVVAERAGRIVGCLQLTFIPGLSRSGAKRAQIESVRVARDERGRGLGRELFEWAMARAREADCQLVQLTSDKAREDAHRFYESLGFVATHDGFKANLDTR